MPLSKKRLQLRHARLCRRHQKRSPQLKILTVDSLQNNDSQKMVNKITESNSVAKTSYSDHSEMVCILCCCPRTRRKDKNNDDNLAKFLIQQILPCPSLIPEENLEFLEQSDDINFCKTCLRLMVQGQGLHDQIVQLQNELEQVKIKAKRSVAESALVKEEDDNYSSEIFELYRKIREQLLMDFDVDDVDVEVAEDDMMNELNELPTWSEMEIDTCDDKEEGEDHIKNAGIEVSVSDPLALTPSESLSIQNVIKIDEKNEMPNQQTKLINPMMKQVQQHQQEPHSSAFLDGNENFQKFKRKEIKVTYVKTTPKFQQLDKFTLNQPQPSVIIAAVKSPPLLIAHRKYNEGISGTELSVEPMVSSPLDVVKLNSSKGLRTASTKPKDNRRNLLPKVRKLPIALPSIQERIYPCIICPDVFKTAKDTSLHRKFLHPGLAACASQVLSWQCGKIFKSRDIKRHRKESHPLLKCPRCSEAFSAKEKLVIHMNTFHHYFSGSPNSINPPLPDCGYDVKLIPWVHPLTKDDLLEANSGQEFKSLRISLERITSDKPALESNESQNINVKEDSEVDCSTKKGPSEIETSSSLPVPDAIPISEENSHETKAREIVPTENPVRVPPKKIRYNCGVCNTKFLVEAKLMQHLQEVHNSKRQFACIVCQKQFDSLSACQSHIFTEHPEAPAAAAAPLNKTPLNLSVEKRHQKQWPFWCKVCRKRFANLEALQKHSKSEEHTLTVEHGIICPEKGCNYYYCGDMDLATHKAGVHSDSQKCPECNRKFLKAANLIDHRIRKHGYISTEPSPDPTIYQCHTCGKTYSREYHLKNHMMVHREGAEDRKKCPKCNKVFRNGTAMRNHLKYVHDKTPGSFVCDVCPKRFINAYKLRHHRAIHGEERPFLCSECGKAFKTRTHLTIHNYGHDPDRFTKHYPYKILVQRRLETQKKRELKAMESGQSDGIRKSRKNRRMGHRSSPDPDLAMNAVVNQPNEGALNLNSGFT